VIRARRRLLRCELACALLALASCAIAPPPAPWQQDPGRTLQAAQAAGADTVFYFALPGRDLSDRMEQNSLRSDSVLAALERGGFWSARIDGFAQAQRYDQWVGGGEGMGVCVLDAEGHCYAARPGPQDPPELAAWLALVAKQRSEVAAARAAVAASPRDPAANYHLGGLWLELGYRKDTEAVLRVAAEGGIADAWQRLARLAVLGGQLEQARTFLAKSPDTAATAFTWGYLRYKERRHAEAARILRAALQRPDLGADRQRVQLFLGKALHEAGAEAEATRVLQSLIAEGTGSTLEGAARHTLQHIQSPDHGHTH
jgi:tetratricopeptide (TPR) repeat protein